MSGPAILSEYQHTGNNYSLTWEWNKEFRVGREPRNLRDDTKNIFNL